MVCLAPVTVTALIADAFTAAIRATPIRASENFLDRIATAHVDRLRAELRRELQPVIV